MRRVDFEDIELAVLYASGHPRERLRRLDGNRVSKVMRIVFAVLARERGFGPFPINEYLGACQSVPRYAAGKSTIDKDKTEFGGLSRAVLEIARAYLDGSKPVAYPIPEEEASVQLSKAKPRRTKAGNVDRRGQIICRP